MITICGKLNYHLIVSGTGFYIYTLLLLSKTKLSVCTSYGLTHCERYNYSTKHDMFVKQHAHGNLWSKAQGHGVVSIDVMFYAQQP